MGQVFEFIYILSLHMQLLLCQFRLFLSHPPLTKISQALAAASKTVDFRKIVHSFHSYFLLVGDVDSMNQPLIPLPPSKSAFFFSLNSLLIIYHFLAVPIIYQVHRIRDGNNFATRRVDAIQKGNIIFILMASFQVLPFIWFINTLLLLSASERHQPFFFFFFNCEISF